MITLVKNNEKLVPVENTMKQKIASVAIGSTAINDFQLLLRNYARVDCFTIDKSISKKEHDDLLEKIRKHDMVIISLHSTSRFLAKDYGITESERELVNEIAMMKKTLLVDFANMYSIAGFNSVKNLLVCYEESALNMNTAAQMIFGTLPAIGTLPATVNDTFQIGDGIIQSQVNSKFRYVLPEEENVDSKVLARIDSLARYGIDIKAYPGCQVMVARHGNVIYQKSFGTFTYGGKREVNNSDIFDLASISKVSATLLEVMRLYEEGRIDLNQKLSFYLPELKKTNKKDVTIRQMLLHEGGMKSWIPFYKSTIVNGKMDSSIYCDTRSSQFYIQVAENVYMNSSYLKKMWTQINNSEMKTVGQYVYSDLDFIYLKKVIEKITGNNFEEELYKNFYEPLGLATMTYLPLQKFKKDEIVPTENDKTFRKQLLQGYVHDPAAAMMGGVAGHAGLFSNANDLAVLFQMLNNYGTYNGRKYFDSTTVRLFTSYNSTVSRRGYGFDKPEYSKMRINPVCDSASGLSFGHSGFTGTFVWADPKYNIVYVFLSNRVNPDQDNEKIIKSGIRTKIQQTIYDAIRNEELKIKN